MWRVEEGQDFCSRFLDIVALRLFGGLGAVRLRIAETGKQKTVTLMNNARCASLR